jgi:hypothetical protein
MMGLQRPRARLLGGARFNNAATKVRMNDAFSPEAHVAKAALGVHSEQSSKPLVKVLASISHPCPPYLSRLPVMFSSS